MLLPVKRSFTHFINNGLTMDFNLRIIDEEEEESDVNLSDNDDEPLDSAISETVLYHAADYIDINELSESGDITWHPADFQMRKLGIGQPGPVDDERPLPLTATATPVKISSSMGAASSATAAGAGTTHQSSDIVMLPAASGPLVPQVPLAPPAPQALPTQLAPPAPLSAALPPMPTLTAGATTAESRKRRKKMIIGAAGMGSGGAAAADDIEDEFQRDWTVPPYITRDIPAFTASPGPIIQQPDLTPLQAFDLYFNFSKIINLITRESNIYTHIKGFNKATAISHNDIYGFLAVIIYMGLTSCPAERDYWLTDDPTIPACVKDIMPRNHFLHIKRSLSVAHPSEQENKQDKLAKVRPLLQNVLTIIKQHYIPAQDLGLDESCVQCSHRNARCSFRAQKHKPTKDFIKVVAVHESNTGYCCGFEVDERVGKPIHDVVLSVVSHLRQQPYRIATDRWYTSVPTALALLERGLYMYGTLCANRQYPESLSNKKNELQLKDGEFCSAFSEKLYCCVWRDSLPKGVLFLSACHGNAEGIVKRRVKGTGIVEKRAPAVAVDYNKNMGPCDRSNALKENYSVQLVHHRRWYMGLIYYSFEILLINAHVYYNASCGAGQQLPQKAFRKIVAAELVRRSKANTGEHRSAHSATHKAADHMPFTTTNVKKQCQHCYNVHKKQFKITTGCSTCSVYLHIECYADYHKSL